MTRSTFASKIARRFIIATSAAGVFATISFISTGCAILAHSQTGSTTANCQGPGTIIASLCMAPDRLMALHRDDSWFSGISRCGELWLGRRLLGKRSALYFTGISGHRWTRRMVGDNDQRAISAGYKNLTYDANQNPTGYSRVRQTATIDSTGTNYTGSGDFAYYDTNGNAIPGASGTFTISAKKILVSQPGS